MEYTAFIDLLKNKMVEQLPERYKKAEVKVEAEEVDGISVDKVSVDFSVTDSDEAGIKGFNLNPTGKELHEILLEEGEEFFINYFCEVITEGLDELVRLDEVTPRTMEQAKDKIVLSLMSTTLYSDKLKNRPTREYLDLSVTYSVVVSTEEKGSYFSPITNETLAKFGGSEEDLFAAAMENTKIICEPKVVSMNEFLIHDLTERQGMPEFLAEMIVESSEPSPFYIITNDTGKFGSSAILNDEFLFNTAESLDNNFFIMPSTFDELLILPVSNENDLDTDMLEEMFEDIEVENIDDLLSKNLYYYDRSSKELRIFDIPIKEES